MTNRTPAQLYSFIIGAVLVLIGVIGFFYQASFTSDEAVHKEIFGWFEVNGWHNLLHVVTGAIGLIAVASVSFSRIYALVLGILYIVLAVWGFIINSSDSILGIFPINTGDNVLHAIVGILGLVAVTVSMEHIPKKTPTATA